MDDTNDWGWLDVTHTLTYTDALRWAWSVDPSPEVLRGLFHAVWFVQWTGQLDAKDHPPPVAPHVTERSPTRSSRRSFRGTPSPLSQPSTATRVNDRPMEAALARAAAEDHSVAPIMVAHTVKTAQASITESRALGEAPDARAPMAAAARFLASPKRERFVYQATLEAISFIEGRSKGETSPDSE